MVGRLPDCARLCVSSYHSCSYHVLDVLFFFNAAVPAVAPATTVVAVKRRAPAVSASSALVATSTTCNTRGQARGGVLCGCLPPKCGHVQLHLHMFLDVCSCFWTCAFAPCVKPRQ